MTPYQTLVFTLGMILLVLSAMEVWRPQVKAIVA